MMIYGQKNWRYDDKQVGYTKWRYGDKRQKYKMTLWW